MACSVLLPVVLAGIAWADPLTLIENQRAISGENLRAAEQQSWDPGPRGILSLPSPERTMVMKRTLMSALGLSVALAIAFVAFRVPDTDRAEMIAKYTNEHSRFLDTADGRIHYRDQGPRDAPPLLLIHGSNSSLHTWEPTIDELAGRYRIISFDMPGHGLSGPSKSRDYRAGPTIDSTLRVLDAVGVERATWVGSSMGGWIAWRAALDVPDRVAGLVLVDATGAEADVEMNLYLGAQLAETWLGAKLMPYITPVSLVRKSLEQSVAEPSQLNNLTIARYWELLRFPGNRQATVDRASVDREPAAWSRIGSLRTPTLIIWGDQDQIVPLPFAEAFHKAIPRSTLAIMKKTGHLPMEERPVDFARILDDWSRRHCTPCVEGMGKAAMAHNAKKAQ
jgi:pimeloyl-ACP methyl ester carboxylesterase